MIFLKILKVIADICFFAGAYWVAMLHHHDATFTQFVVVVGAPRLISEVLKWMIAKAKERKAVSVSA